MGVCNSRKCVCVCGAGQGHDARLCAMCISRSHACTKDTSGCMCAPQAAQKGSAHRTVSLPSCEAKLKAKQGLYKHSMHDVLCSKTSTSVRNTNTNIEQVNKQTETAIKQAFKSHRTPLLLQHTAVCVLQLSGRLQVSWACQLSTPPSVFIVHEPPQCSPSRQQELHHMPRLRTPPATTPICTKAQTALNWPFPASSVPKMFTPSNLTKESQKQSPL
ncbi:hypothetical protein COO60DRAFT_378032 [Scenedesmus sp. NREL 46B-D3]|nr:hypothetical protein COO60DRAFT_378032 [Scenedesmus sp. NREL 46B-D3]